MKKTQFSERNSALLLLVALVVPLVAVAAVDDHGDTYDTGTAVTVNGAAAPGEIEVADDEDWFNFAAAEGTSYNISITPGTISGKCSTFTSVPATIAAP